MGQFTFVPLWIIQDLIVYAIGFSVLIFILRREARPESILAELLAFSFLNAAVYENYATLMGWYGYGRSFIMVFNVPFSIPLVEYLVIYSSLRLLALREIPGWAKPFIVGLSGMVFDFSLDPVAVRQVFETTEGSTGRWSWYPGPVDVQIGGEPVYNFSGWILLCGYFSAAVLAGRYWLRRSGWNPKVGLIYPFVSALVALGILVSPLSPFLLWLAPFMERGSPGEWIMLGVDASLGLLFLWHFGRKGRAMPHPRPVELPALLVLAGLPLLNLTLCLVEGFFDVLPLVAIAALSQTSLVLVWTLGGRSRSSEVKVRA